jgi:uncharacterized protein (DUF488 family)
LPALFTIGHGPKDRSALGSVLLEAGVETLVDVRRFPGSRTNPEVRREALEEWLPTCGISYRWEPRLGGRRQNVRGAAVVDCWWTVAAFQAYAAHTRTEDFRDALDLVLVTARGERTAVMCSESVWWRCHRRLIADVAVLGHGAAVEHLLPGGRRQAHPPAPGARVRDDGCLVWDGPGG